MKQCVIQPSMVVEEMVSDRRDRDSLVCPKPRRLGLRLNLSHQAEKFDSVAVAAAGSGSDLFDIILSKGEGGNCTQLASSPPFFCGSPPSRVANPLIHDSLFGDDKINPLSSTVMLPSSPSSGRKGGGSNSSGCVRPNFGSKPAVRIEGFDCLDRDSRNCSIPALA